MARRQLIRDRSGLRHFLLLVCDEYIHDFLYAFFHFQFAKRYCGSCDTYQ